MKCKICGRALKNERSREAGYGPVCYKRRFGSGIPAKCRERIPPAAGSATYTEVPGQMKVYDYLQVIGAV